MSDAKKAILARRAKFVAAAIAGLGIACGKERAAACLSIAAPPQDANAAPPEPPAWTPPEADPANANADAGTIASDAGPPPRPCLQPVPLTAEPPRPCLSIAPPKRDAGSNLK